MHRHHTSLAERFFLLKHHGAHINSTINDSRFPYPHTHTSIRTLTFTHTHTHTRNRNTGEMRLTKKKKKKRENAKRTHQITIRNGLFADKIVEKNYTSKNIGIESLICSIRSTLIRPPEGKKKKKTTEQQHRPIS